MAQANLREALARGPLVVAPGLYDMLSALIADKIGFDFVYASGYWLTASCYGLPDAGLVTYTQMLDRVATLVQTVKAGVIADADTGFGGLLNVRHTVRGYEQAGVAAIQIEDQEFPKKCGHTPFKRVIPLEEMATKVEVACEARRRPESMLVIARTDARQGEGLASTIARARAYAAAGADVIFVEALESAEEMKQVCEAIDRPLLINMADGGRTPILPLPDLEKLGFKLAIFPARTALAAATAVEKALRTLRGGDATSDIPSLFSFEEMCRLLGFQEVWDFEAKWRPAESR